MVVLVKLMVIPFIKLLNYLFGSLFILIALKFLPFLVLHNDPKTDHSASSHYVFVLYYLFNMYIISGQVIIGSWDKFVVVQLLNDLICFILGIFVDMIT